MPIRLLSTDVSSKIAAGEVVERPASVVKELVENSLDSGASEIAIEIRAGGTEYIRVADDGVGIPDDEVELAFQRFATSKLSESPDLEGISTLGFRGEALPSIAAVSTVSLVTRTRSDGAGTLAEVSNGEIVRRQRQGAAPGTAVTVRQLFRALPARRKFLKTPATEASRIQTVVSRYILAYPRVGFQLTLDDSPVYASSGSGDLREAIAVVYGPQVARSMLELSWEPSGDEALIAPSGMIGSPPLARANRNQISVFVNGRWVQSRPLSYALEEAYRGFLPERRFPIAVVNLTLPYDEVDVNVHPSKTEVRFHHDRLAFSTIQQAARHTLTTHMPVPEVGEAPVATPPPSGQPRSGFPWARRTSDQPGTPSAQAVAGHTPSPHPPAEGPASPSYPEPLVPHKALPALRVLGQVQSTYIAAEGPDGVYLIDQHAAHERVLFERVTAETAAAGPQVQGLIEPATVELSPGQSELLEAHAGLIARLGFQVEAFGGRTYILRGVPGLLSGGDPREALLDVLDLMAEGGGFESWEERAAYSVACHGAIRAGKTLSQQEMSELTRQLELCDQPHTCPHGRPTMVHMSSARLEQEFGRR